jgi:pimeloyl-ACP methyl ester carboxylesterase
MIGIDADAVSLHVERWGRGSPVVLTHGLGSSSQTWSPLRRHLPEGWDYTTWDLRGHGRSGTSSLYSREAGIADLARVLDDVAGGAPAVLVGHSLGGYLSLGLAIARPDLVRALVLIATGPGFRDEQRRETWNDMLVRQAPRLGVPAVVTGLCAQPDAMVLEHLDTIDVPVVAIVGAGDHRFHAAAEVFGRRLDATVHVVLDAGHHPHEHQPMPVATAIVELLGRIGKPGRSSRSA